MKLYFKLAWRNLWRNRRRTILTILSVFFAVFLALIMRSMQLGSYNMMIESAVKSSTGYLQVHDSGYWEDKSINNTFESSCTLEEQILSIEHVSNIVPRLESFTLASSGEKTKGVALIGTDVEKEDEVSGLSKKIVSGRYLEPGDKGALVAEGLALYLGLSVNDTLVMLSQGYHGVTAAAAYPVIGIARFAGTDMNNSMIYLPLSESQNFYSAPGRITSISVLLDDPKKIDDVHSKLEVIDPEHLEVMTWKEMMPELVQGIQGDNISGLFMLGILYLVVGFGIFGTIMMMTMERRKEFGIMVAIGMRRTKLAVVVFIESIIVGIMGVMVGMAVSTPVILYLMHNPIRLQGEAANAVAQFNMEPIMPFILEPGFYLHQGMIVIIIALIAVLYPLVHIGKFRIIPALRTK